MHGNMNANFTNSCPSCERKDVFQLSIYIVFRSRAYNIVGVNSTNCDSSFISRHRYN